MKLLTFFFLFLPQTQAIDSQSMEAMVTHYLNIIMSVIIMPLSGAANCHKDFKDSQPEML